MNLLKIPHVAWPAPIAFVLALLVVAVEPRASRGKEVQEVDHQQIERTLETYGAALSGGDLDVIADSWDIPSLVLGDQGSIAVTDRQQVRDFFAQATEWYRAQGYASTRPQVEQIRALSDRLVGCEVQWPMLDASGSEKGRERSSYVLRLGDDGKLRIAVAFTTG